MTSMKRRGQILLCPKPGQGAGLSLCFRGGSLETLGQTMGNLIKLAIAFTAALVLVFYILPGDEPEPMPDYDVVVVGGGISGLSAALELGRKGARVLVVEMNSIAGGHAVMAGGFAFADTPLQRAQGIEDSPDAAYEDWMAWGETNDPNWTRAYADNATEWVHDWLTELGVEFKVLLPSPENRVRRFHFTQGKAVHAVLPILQDALRHSNVSFAWNTEAVDLVKNDRRIRGVRLRNMRDDEERGVSTRYVLLATGGFQNDLDRVRRNWAQGDAPFLLKGAGQFAVGLGHDLALDSGAGRTRFDTHVTFLNGLRDPRDPESALVASNPHWVWLNGNGQRFANESGSDKDVLPEILKQGTSSYWAIVDARGLKSFRIRDAVWLNASTVASEIYDNPEIVLKDDTIEGLGAKMGLEPTGLAATLSRYNQFIEDGNDADFGRFRTEQGRLPTPIVEPPFYAMQLHLVTRKNLGGIAVDNNLNVLDADGNPIDGLYASGELTGVVGINGGHGMSGTFLGPSVFTGRLAAQAIFRGLKETEDWNSEQITRSDGSDASNPNWDAPFDTNDLVSMLETRRPGYWHFEVSHGHVLEQQWDCAMCHSGDHPMSQVTSQDGKLFQTNLCLSCH